MTAEQQDLCVTWLQRSKNQAHLLLFLSRCVGDFGTQTLGRTDGCTLIVCSARPPAKFIERHSHRRPIKPGARTITSSVRIPPPFPENLNRNIFRARRISDNPADHAGDAAVMGMKKGVEIHRGLAGGRAIERACINVHDRKTPLGFCL